MNLNGRNYPLVQGCVKSSLYKSILLQFIKSYGILLNLESFHSRIQGFHSRIYIAPLQGNYSEVICWLVAYHLMVAYTPTSKAFCVMHGAEILRKTKAGQS